MLEPPWQRRARAEKRTASSLHRDPDLFVVFPMPELLEALATSPSANLLQTQKSNEAADEPTFRIAVIDPKDFRFSREPGILSKFARPALLRGPDETPGLKLTVTSPPVAP